MWFCTRSMLWRNLVHYSCQVLEVVKAVVCTSTSFARHLFTVQTVNVFNIPRVHWAVWPWFLLLTAWIDYVQCTCLYAISTTTAFLFFSSGGHFLECMRGHIWSSRCDAQRALKLAIRISSLHAFLTYGMTTRLQNQNLFSLDLMTAVWTQQCFSSIQRCRSPKSWQPATWTRHFRGIFLEKDTDISFSTAWQTQQRDDSLTTDSTWCCSWVYTLEHFPLSSLAPV